MRRIHRLALVPVLAMFIISFGWEFIGVGVTADNSALVDPRIHGGVGDGVTDDTAAFRTAAAAAAGKTLFIPPGITFLVAGIEISANTIVTGGGTLKLKALSNFFGSPILKIIGDNVVIDGITLDGNKASQSASGFADSYDTGAHGTGRAYRCAIKADGVGDGLTVKNCLIRNTFGAGIAARYVKNVMVSENRFEKLNFEAVIFYSSIQTVTGGGGSGHRILNNKIYNVDSGNRGTAPNGNAFVLSDVRGALVSGNYALDIGRTLVKLENCEDVVVNNNTFINSINKYAGIQTQSSARRITISGNFIRNAGIGIQIGGSRGISDIVVTGNTIDNTTNENIGDGIQVPDAVTSSLFSNNVIRNQRRAGIIIPRVGAGVVVSGNIVDGLLGTSYWGYTFSPADNNAEMFLRNNYSRESAGFAEGGMAKDEGVVFVSPATGARFAYLEISGNVLMTRSDHPGGRGIGMTTVGMFDKALVRDNYTDGKIEYYDKKVVGVNNYSVDEMPTAGSRDAAGDTLRRTGDPKIGYSIVPLKSGCTVGDIVFKSGADNVVLWQCAGPQGTWKPWIGRW